MKCIFVTYGQKESGLATFRLYFIPRDKLQPSGRIHISSLGASPLGMKYDSSFRFCNLSLGMKYTLQGAKPNSSFP